MSHQPPCLDTATKCQSLLKQFEGHEAIYIEQGVLRVRVSGIACRSELRQVHADVEEIPTPGFEHNIICSRSSLKNRPLKWHIVSGFLTSVSGNKWKVGYGGWQLYFSTDLITGIKNLAANSQGHPVELYNQVIKYLIASGGYDERPSRLFPARAGEHGLIKSN